MNEAKVVLFGHPNVGKSSLFTLMTGYFSEVSNYPGTTVEIYRGHFRRGNTRVTVIDVPGSFSTVPSTVAEDIARRIILEEKPDAIIHVVDATSIKRHLYLTMELLDFGIPMVLALNQIDRAKNMGITIDKEKIERELGIPAILVSATTKEGLKELVNKVLELVKDRKIKTKPFRLPEDIAEKVRLVEQAIANHLDHHKSFARIIACWTIMGDSAYQDLTTYIPADIKSDLGDLAKKIMMTRTSCVERIFRESVKSHARVKLKKMEYILMKPLYGTFLAIALTFLVLWGTLAIIHVVGHKIPYLLYEYYDPFVRYLVGLIKNDILEHILVGEEAGVYSSLGLLTTGVFFVFFMILPAMFVLYIVMGLLEDVGFIPRVSVSCHGGMTHMGMSGSSVAPMLAGTGCSIVSILLSRALRSERERFLSSFITVFGVPCMAQQVVIWALLGRYGVYYILALYLTLLASIFLVGVITSHFIHGEMPQLIIELPAWRKPSLGNVFRKTMARMRSFLINGVPLVFLGVLIVNLAYYSGVAYIIADTLGPIIGGIFGIPKEASLAFIIGLLRKDVAVGILGSCELTPIQMFVAITVITLYFPCIGSLLILLSEFGPKKALLAILLMLGFSVAIGFMLHAISTIFF